MAKKKFEPKESFSVLTKCEAFYTGGKVQFTRDGQYILSLCHEKLKKFQITNGESQDAIESVDELSCFLLAEDDVTLITAAKSEVMRHYDISSKTLLKTWKSLHIGPVSCMAFDPTTTLLATGGSDSTVKVWDIIRKYYTHNLKGGKGVFSKVCFQKLGSELHVIGAADDYCIHVWNLHSSALVASLPGHFSTITDLIFDQDKGVMLSSSRDKCVLVWNLLNLSSSCKPKTIPVYESVEAIILVPRELALPDLSLNSEETYFITVGDKGILKVWSADSGKSEVLPGGSSYEGSLITQGSYVSALNAIGLTTFEHNIMLYSLENFSIKKQFVGYNDDILSMQFLGSSDSHLAVATNSSQIKVFEFPNFSCQLLKGHLDIVMTVNVFPKHKNYLVSGSKDNNVKVWKMEKESTLVSCMYTGYGHTDSVTTVACCRGKSKFFASGSQDTTLKLWEIPDKKPVLNKKPPIFAPFCTVKAHDKHINCIDIAENDKILASASQDHTAKIWDAKDLSLLGTLRGHKKGVWSVTFSPVDLAVATSSGDETIRIWSLVDYSCLRVFQGHEATVLQVSFLSRGTQIISSASDGNIKLWDIKNNMCINTLEGHSTKVWTLTSSSSEEYLVSGGADSNIIVWQDTTSPEKEKKIAEIEKFVLEEQKLSNLVHEKKWTKALGLAITLDKPHLAYNIIEELLLQENGQAAFEKVFSSMEQDQKEVLLKFSVEWITNAKTSFPAVVVINLFQCSYDFQEILKMPSMPSHIRDLLPYLDRHFKRLNRRCQDMQILNFICQQFKLTGRSGKKHGMIERSEEPILNDPSLNATSKRNLQSEDGDGKKMRLDTVD